MQNSLSRYISIALITLLCLARSVTAGEDNTSPQTLSYPKMPPSAVRVAVDDATLHAAPDADSPSVWSVPWVQNLLVDSRRMSEAPADWIPIKGTDGKKTARGKGARPDAWIRRRDVVIGEDYKKVVGCWPVKSVVYVGGDYTAEVTFKLDGSAIVKEWGDEEWINKQSPHQAHVYMARNIVAIEAVKKNGPAFFTSGYHPAERQLYPEGVRAEKQELFPDTMLKGCESVPLLAK